VLFDFWKLRFPETHTLTLSLVRERASNQLLFSAFQASDFQAGNSFFDSPWSGRGHQSVSA
jgi:hypothetical protein